MINAIDYISEQRQVKYGDMGNECFAFPYILYGLINYNGLTIKYPLEELDIIEIKPT